MRKLADYLFQPLIDMLTDSYDRLIQAGKLATQGIDVEKFFAPVATMGSSWVTMVKVLVMCTSVIVTVFIGKGMFTLYRQFKDGVKWW